MCLPSSGGLVVLYAAVLSSAPNTRFTSLVHLTSPSPPSPSSTLLFLIPPSSPSSPFPLYPSLAFREITKSLVDSGISSLPPALSLMQEAITFLYIPSLTESLLQAADSTISPMVPSLERRAFVVSVRRWLGAGLTHTTLVPLADQSASSSLRESLEGTSLLPGPSEEQMAPLSSRASDVSDAIEEMDESTASSFISAGSSSSGDGESADDAFCSGSVCSLVGVLHACARGGEKNTGWYSPGGVVSAS